MSMMMMLIIIIMSTIIIIIIIMIIIIIIIIIILKAQGRVLGLGDKLQIKLFSPHDKVQGAYIHTCYHGYVYTYIYIYIYT